MNKKIIIVGGDPNSINSEIIYKTWKKLSYQTKKNIYLIANFDLINLQLKKLKYNLNLVKTENLKDNNNFNSLKVIDIPLRFKNIFKVSVNQSSGYLIKSLNLAHKLAITNKVKGIINCPINKKLIKSFKVVGVTEYFASKCNIKDHSEVMMLHNKSLSVVPLTTHINIKDVSKTLSTNLIIRKVKTLNRDYKKLLKKKPKIGILGLNPHNAELRTSSEEFKKISPAIRKLRKKGININGPLVADTTFIDNYKKFDVIIGCYHDQVLIPFKTLFNFDAINITLGLSYIRVSPDHGPALDLIGKNQSKYLSLLRCIKFIDNLN